MDIDDTQYTLTEHLTELRDRLLKALIAVVLTTAACGIFAEDILQYSIEPLQNVLSAQNRVDVLLLRQTASKEDRLIALLEGDEDIRFRGVAQNLEEALSIAQHSKSLDLLLVDTQFLQRYSDLEIQLETIQPTPTLVYLLAPGETEIALDLLLQGALVIRAQPRIGALRRVIRTAAGTAGKAAGKDKLVVLSPLEPFFAYLKIALVCGLFLACPVWLLQAWKFVAPGLYRHEKKAVIPVVTTGSLLFIGGGLFAYYVMFPMMFDVLINKMMPESLVGSFTIDNYLGFLLRVTVAFGVVFELPLAMGVLASVGLVDAGWLKKQRKYAIVISFITGALLTPADPISQVFMALPLIVFYEIGIILARILGTSSKPDEASL